MISTQGLRLTRAGLRNILSAGPDAGKITVSQIGSSHTAIRAGNAPRQTAAAPYRGNPVIWVENRVDFPNISASPPDQDPWLNQNQKLTEFDTIAAALADSPYIEHNRGSLNTNISGDQCERTISLVRFCPLILKDGAPARLRGNVKITALADVYNYHRDWDQDTFDFLTSYAFVRRIQWGPITIGSTSAIHYPGLAYPGAPPGETVVTQDHADTWPYLTPSGEANSKMNGVFDGSDPAMWHLDSETILKLTFIMKAV